MKILLVQDDKLVTFSLYESGRVLWDPKYEQYFSRQKEEDAWRDISISMEIDVEEIKKKMTSLLGSFRRERSKEKISSVLHFSRFLYLSLSLLWRYHDYVINID
nr:unnamed protein product [Callosobruchus chinensis]